MNAEIKTKKQHRRQQLFQKPMLPFAAEQGIQ
jgi:hypothetical protein